MVFTWDPKKAASNLRKHGVSFPEASSVIGDPLATTFPDEEHSLAENRFVTVGASRRNRVLVVIHADQRGPSESLAPGTQFVARLNSMRTASTKKSADRDTMRPEYDFAAMKGGVRGKCAKQYRAGTNLVLLDPEVHAAFPTAEAVNDALRAVLAVAKTVRAGRRAKT